MRIYVAGAGAMGGRFGVYLTKAGEDVIFLENWEEHLEAINRQGGIRVTGDVEETVPVNIVRPSEASSPADLLIVLVKSYQLEEMMTSIRHLVTDQTKVVCLLNGLGHFKTLSTYVKPENIIMGVTVWTAGLHKPGKIELKGPGSLMLSSPSGPGFCQDVLDIFNRANLNATYEENLDYVIWNKALLNGVVNASSAILDARVGELFQSDDAIAMMRGILAEFVAAAHLQGVDFDVETSFTSIRDIVLKVAHHYPTMHQDLIQNKRLTEVDYLNGWVADFLEANGQSAPYCRMATQIIHAKEVILSLD